MDMGFHRVDVVVYDGTQEKGVLRTTIRGTQTLLKGVKEHIGFDPSFQLPAEERS